jgi:hypothetical protein
MPIAIVWDDDDRTILRRVFTDPWDWADFHMAVQTSNTLAQTVNHAVAIINDVTGTQQLPQGAFGQFKAIARLDTISARMIFFVGGNAFTTSMFEMFRRFYKDESADWFTARTLHDARQIIAEKRGENESNE